MEISSQNIKIILSQTSSLEEAVLSFNDNQSLIEQGVDSLDNLDFFLKIEETFDISIPDSDIDKLDTIEKIRVYLEEKKE